MDVKFQDEELVEFTVAFRRDGKPHEKSGHTRGKTFSSVRSLKEFLSQLELTRDEVIFCEAQNLDGRVLRFQPSPNSESEIIIPPVEAYIFDEEDEGPVTYQVMGEDIQFTE